MSAEAIRARNLLGEASRAYPQREQRQRGREHAARSMTGSRGRRAHCTLPAQPLPRPKQQSSSEQELVWPTPSARGLPVSAVPGPPTMDDGDDNAFFRLKAIGFGGRNVPILAQNENGPCPLLAIANVLLLRGSIEIHPDRPQVSYEELVELVGDYLLTSNQHASASAELSANHAQNLSDCMAMFPTLRRGLDINVRFTGYTARSPGCCRGCCRVLPFAVL